MVPKAVPILAIHLRQDLNVLSAVNYTKKAKTIIIKFLIVIVGVSLAFISFFILKNNQDQKPQGLTAPKTDSTSEQKTIPGFNGKVIAGEKSPYLEFNKNDYQKAQSGGKIIFLDFYANWCPICRAEAPELIAGFNSLTTDKVIGFRVNFNDTETDQDEKNLAREFQIPYQHTKVIIKNGQEVLKSLESWDQKRFIEEINRLQP